MDSNEILKTINEVFIDVLDNEDIVLTRETTAHDVEEWDSLNHLQLIVAIEKKFKLRFATQEIHGWNNIGDMIDSIAAKING